MPLFYYLKDEQTMQRTVPDPESYVMPAVFWGRPEVFFTPAYWMTQHWMREGNFSPRSHSFGETLEEEVVACLLGGHGIPAEVALAAFDRLRSRGLLSSPYPGSDILSKNLREPLIVAGRQITYRFWSQKANYISTALRTLNEQPHQINHRLH